MYTSLTTHTYIIHLWTQFESYVKGVQPFISNDVLFFWSRPFAYANGAMAKDRAGLASLMYVLQPRRHPPPVQF